MRSTRCLYAAATAIKHQVQEQTSQQILINRLEIALQGSLRRAYGRKRRTLASSGRPHFADVTFRHEVVSETLCDDAIKYLAPSLEKHKGCVVVDFNPGACLWSSRLHDFLQPKRHLLMESDDRYVEPFIKPLLEKPHSTYRYTPLEGFDSLDLYKNYEQVMNDHDLFPVESVPPGDPQRQKFDPGVLFVGNLARPPIGGMPRKAGSFFTFSIIRFAGAMVTNELIHKNGLARMLFWVPEADKSTLFAYAESAKSKVNLSTGLVSDMIEAVGVTPLVEIAPKLVDLRGPALEEVENQRVRASMQKLGMQPTRELLQNYPYPATWSTTTPDRPQVQGTSEDIAKEAMATLGVDSNNMPHIKPGETEAKPAKRRRSVVVPTRIAPVPAPDPMLFISPWESPLTTQQEFSKYLADTERRVDDLNAVLNAVSMGASTNAATLAQDTRILEMARHIEFTQFHHTVERASIRTQSQMVKLRAVARWDTCLRVYKLELFLQKLMEQGLVSTEFFDATRRTINHLAHEAEGSSKPMLTQHIGSTLNRHKTIVDHQISFFSDPPGLARDRRLYEPLKATEEEFWPAGKLMLLDMQPKEVDYLVSDLVSASEQSTIISQLLTQLLHATATSLGKAMDSIAPNMAEDLIPKCPSMSNPGKGGRLDAANMRVAMLTEDMIKELIVAFIEWPFRPSTLALELADQGTDLASRDEDLAGLV